MHWKIFSTFLAAACWARAGTEPVKVPFDCGQEELTAAGMLCSDDDPCPVYLELSGISAAGKNLALAGNLHGRSATISSLLLMSDDNGITWKEPAARISGAALEQVQLIDPLHGWAAGETQMPLARDPFFLITSDGGASWRREPVTEEGTAGAVQRFWFDSREHAELIVESGRTYSLYESNNGGDSWNIVSNTAQVPRLRRVPVAADMGDYRIVTDSRNHTFSVEKRDGEKWMPIATFPVQVANCGSSPPPTPDEK